MSASPRPVLLTDRALGDIAEIEDSSKEKWGEEVAARYIDDLERALERLREYPDLLHPDPALHPSLGFYSVNRHMLICARHPQASVVLTVLHQKMDIPARLAELQPELVLEVELLQGRLEEGDLQG